MSEAISKCKLSKQGLRLDVCLCVLGILVSICLCPAFSIAEAATLGRIDSVRGEQRCFAVLWCCHESEDI
jgi:hypothetical protein